MRCVEGYGQNLYVGGSDGVVEWWVCDGGSSSQVSIAPPLYALADRYQAEGWTLRHKHTLFPRRPVGKIILLPKVSRCFVLSDGTLHPLALPSLDVLPSTVMAPLRGVVSLVLDDEELDWGGPGSEERERGAEMTVVVVRRKGMAVYKLGARMQLVKVSRSFDETGTLLSGPGNSVAASASAPRLVIDVSLRGTAVPVAGRPIDQYAQLRGHRPVRRISHGGTARIAVGSCHCRFRAKSKYRGHPGRERVPRHQFHRSRNDRDLPQWPG